MVAINIDNSQHGAITEEIQGLIRVYKDGNVERPQIIPFVTSALPPETGVISRDISIDNSANIWARFYVPTKFQSHNNNNNSLLPLMVYFHGGGFCVGSAAWSCYHEFSAKLSAKAACIIMSVNYRLAPEYPLPAAYDDGIKALLWLKQNSLATENQWWSKQCDFCNIVLAGDSAGGNIAYNIIKMVGSKRLVFSPLRINGGVLIQPYFGGEDRTNSEKYLVQSQKSALSLETADTYWRLALPNGADRDHPWCNPINIMEDELLLSVEIPTMVCIAEMDILKDRNMEFCKNLRKKRVVVHKGVGHAFQILSKSHVSQIRTLEMMSQINSFINSIKY